MLVLVWIFFLILKCIHHEEANSHRNTIGKWRQDCYELNVVQEAAKSCWKRFLQLFACQNIGGLVKTSVVNQFS